MTFTCWCFVSWFGRWPSESFVRASRPVSALCAVLDSIRAAPWVCSAMSSSWPEYSNSPVASLRWPAGLTDFPDGLIVVPHFCSNLCGLSGFKHRSDVSRSDGNSGPGWDDGHRLVGFLTNPALTPGLCPISSWRSIFFYGRDGL